MTQPREYRSSCQPSAIPGSPPSAPRMGPVTLVIVDQPGRNRYSLLCQATPIMPPSLIRPWCRRSWIELFFKAIKQNLKIKTFMGTSENAVMTQIWMALITYLILAVLRFKAGLGISFQQLLRLLQISLFDQRSLVDLFTRGQRHIREGRGPCLV